MTRKKGQGAYEFLMTHGWAIISAIIVIGVFAYFGIFNPDTYVQIDWKCLAESFCKNQTLELEHYSNIPYIYCQKNIMENISWIIQFKSDWITLEQMFPECSKCE